MLNQLKKKLNLGVGFWISIALLLVCIGAWYIFLEPRYQKDAGFFSCIYGLMSWVVIWAVRGVRCHVNEKALDRAILGHSPEDGEWRAVIGTIHPSTPTTLTAPFSGKTVLAYKYWVTYLGRRINRTGFLRGKSESTRLTAYTGFAIAPCEIRTASGNVRIKGMPEINAKIETISGREAYESARSYFSNAVFKEVTQGPKQNSDGTRAEPISSVVSSEIIKEDKRYTPSPELNGCTLVEIVVLPGDQMCAYGLYAAEQNCLYAPAKISSGRLFTLVAGDAVAARKTLRAQRTFLYIVISAFLAILILIAWCA